MALSNEERNEHATRIMYEVLQDLDYSLVYEDDELAELGADEDDWKAIHGKMSNPQVIIYIDGYGYDFTD